MFLPCCFYQLNAQSHRVVSNTDNQITFTVTNGDFFTNDITLEEGQFTRLLMAGYASTTGNVGKPELPMITKMIEIPVCREMHVSATAGSVRTLTAEEAGIRHTVYPTQPQYPKSYTGNRPLQKDEATYATNGSYGLPLATISDPFISRDANMATVTICPVQVNPVTNAVTIYEDITVTVTYDNVDMAATREIKTKYASPAFSRPTELINRVEAGITREEISTRPVKMLIIAHDMFNGQLDSLANWKRRKGFLVEIAYTSTTGTTTNAIKNYIAGKFANATASDPAPTYVLLVGDVEQIPAHSGQTDSHYTDLYYYTQVGNDNVPDCYGGRFSAKSIAQLTPQIDKTLNYEQLTMPDLSYLEHCVLVAGNDRGTSGDYGYSLGNPTIHYLADSLAPSYYTIIKTYYNPHANSDEDAIRTELSNGAGYANYTAHCGVDGWADPSFTTSDLSSMNNTNKYGLMIGNCCQSNTFSDNECFGEALLRLANKGAVGYIGGSNNTLWFHDFYWAIGAHGSLSSNCTNCNHVTYDANNLGAYDCLFHTHGETFPNWYVTQGSVIYAGNMAVQDVYGANDTDVKYYWEIYHLMGDPSVMPWLGRPADMNILVDNTEPVNSTIELIDGTTSIAVSTGAPYSYVALTRNFALIAATMTDINGNATLTFPALNAGETYELAASAQNYKTTFTTINVMAGEGARVTITEVAVTGNAQAVANAHLTLDVTIQNRFPEAATNTSISASTTSSQISLTDETETVGTVNSGDIRTLTASFALNVSNAISDGDIAPIVFTVSYLSQGNMETTTYTYNLVLVDALLEHVRDSYTISVGNGDNNIDPGETVTLSIIDRNMGHLDAPDVLSLLSTYYTPAAVTNGTITVGTIGAGEQYTSVFTINIGNDVPVGTIIPYVHHIFSTTNSHADRTDTIYLTVGRIEEVEDWETGDLSQFDWTTSNNYRWTIVNDASEAHGGSYYAKSGNYHAANSASTLELTIDCADGEISFYAKVASEPDYDFFKFLIDGVQMLSYSGGVVRSGGSYNNPTYRDTCTWQRYAYPITAGTHTIKFSFIKDQYVNGGSDCAKVDDITWPIPAGDSLAPMPEGIIITAAGLNANSNGYASETAHFDVTIENNSTSAIEDITLSMTTTSASLTITDATENVASIASGETLDLTGIFTGDIAAVEDGHVVNCTVTADYLLENVPTQQTYHFSFIVHSVTHSLTDESYTVSITSGNSDADINPGENIKVTVYSRNTGNVNAENIVSTLMTTSAYATIEENIVNFASAVPNARLTSQYDIAIDPNTTDNTTIVFHHTITDGTTSDSLSFDILVISDEVGVSENGLSTITLYPNPTSTDVTVSLGDGIKATHIRLSNTFGQLISTTDINHSSAVVNMSQLPNGIYFVQIYNSNELITTSKVVKK